MIILLLNAIILLLLLMYIIGRYNENYWKKRGVSFYKKHKVTGVFWEYIIKNRPMFQVFDELYREYPHEPAIGIGSFLTPSLYVKDPVNVNHVLHKDFQSFNHRGLAFNDSDILAKNILLLNGPKWRLVRQRFTPLFTTAKLKTMYYIIDKSSQDFVKFLKNNPEKLKGNCFETLSTFSGAAISAAVFGFGTKSTFDSPFVKLVGEALHPSSWKNTKFALSSLCTPLFKALGLSLFSVREEWFISLIKQVFRERERQYLRNQDFVDLCISLQQKGLIKDQDTGIEIEPTDELLAAQAYFFFLASLEPCAAVCYATLVELGKNPDILKRIHDEIDETFEKYNEKLTYNAVVEIEYLDKAVHEAIRMYPPIGFLTRECVTDTVLPVGNIKVEKGTKIFTPIYPFHMDPKYFEEPESFKPDRFSREEKPSNLIPFGKGNRICIGLRYGKLQVKACLMYVLRHFTVRTIVEKGGIKYKKQQFQVRMYNVDFEFVSR